MPKQNKLWLHSDDLDDFAFAGGPTWWLLLVSGNPHWVWFVSQTCSIYIYRCGDPIDRSLASSNCCCWPPFWSAASGRQLPPRGDSPDDGAGPPCAGRTDRRVRIRRACSPCACACAWSGWSFGWRLSGRRCICAASHLQREQIKSIKQLL